MEKNNTIPSPEFTQDTKYLLWKQSADELLNVLKSESKNPKETFSMEDIFATLERQDKLHNIFYDWLDFANQMYEYFTNKTDEIRRVTDEYALVDLSGKSTEFLKTFRKNISTHINKYSWYLEEFEKYFGEFKKKFIALGENWRKLSYFESKRKEINTLEDSYATIYRGM